MKIPTQEEVDRAVYLGVEFLRTQNISDMWWTVIIEVGLMLLGFECRNLEEETRELGFVDTDAGLMICEAQGRVYPNFKLRAFSINEPGSNRQIDYTIPNGGRLHGND